MGNNPSKTKRCPECKLWIDAACARPLSRTPLGGGHGSAQGDAVGVRRFVVLLCCAFVAGCDLGGPPAVSADVAIADHGDQKLVEMVRHAREGDPGAQFGLGNRYMNGAGVPRDPGQAAAWYQKSAAQGFHYAQVNLGNMYADGVGVPKDLARAVEWYQLAAVQGDPLAQVSLGNLYWKGEGVAKDAAEAMTWFRKAAMQGVADAQNFLGYGYRTGEGIDQDPAAAVEWYQKAAAQGVENAQLNLGVIYLNGEGVARDRVLACAWFEIVAASANESWRKQGIAERDAVMQKMNAAEIAEARALSSKWTRGQGLQRVARHAGAASRKS